MKRYGWWSYKRCVRYGGHPGFRKCRCVRCGSQEHGHPRRIGNDDVCTVCGAVVITPARLAQLYVKYQNLFMQQLTQQYVPPFSRLPRET